MLPQTRPFVISLGLSLVYNLFRLAEEQFSDETPAGERLKESVAYMRKAPVVGPLVRILLPEHDDDLVEDNPSWEHAQVYFEREREKGKHIYTEYTVNSIDSYSYRFGLTAENDYAREHTQRREHDTRFGQETYEYKKFDIGQTEESAVASLKQNSGRKSKRNRARSKSRGGRNRG